MSRLSTLHQLGKGDDRRADIDIVGTLPCGLALACIQDPVPRNRWTLCSPDSLIWNGLPPFTPLEEARLWMSYKHDSTCGQKLGHPEWKSWDVAV